MHREEAATVSFTRIDVTAARVRLGYCGGPPCESAREVVVETERAVAEGSSAPAQDVP
jgi:hypothetical protein